MNSEDQNPVRIAWVAGLFDGEGTITTHFKPINETKVPQPRCVIRMTHNETIQVAARILLNNRVGVYVEGYDTEKMRTANRKPNWVLTCHGFLRTRAFLELVLPYLVTKREQALTMLAFVYSRQMRLVGQNPSKVHLNENEARLMEHLHNLNAKGRQILNEHTSDTIDVVKMCSELHREMQSCVETYSRLQNRASELRASGMTYQDISETLDKDKITIYGWINGRSKK